MHAPMSQLGKLARATGGDDAHGPDPCSVSNGPKSIMAPGPCAIGVDVGATNTKLVLIGADGHLIANDIVPTVRATAGDGIAEGIVSAVRGFRDAHASASSLSGVIGLGTPCFTEGSDWVQRQAGNIPELEGYPLRPYLAEHLGANLTIAYDSSAAAVAEHRFGKGRGVDRLLTISIGTGVSIGLVFGGQLVDFNWGGTGDSGHLIVDPDATARCSCGGLGCLESVISAPAIVREGVLAAAATRETSLRKAYRDAGHLEAADVVRAASHGDLVASEILDRCARFLGIAVASYLHMFRPNLIVLCGGVAMAGDLLVQRTSHWVHSLASPWYLSRLRGIEVSAFPILGAAIGSAAIALDQTGGLEPRRRRPDQVRSAPDQPQKLS